MHTHVPEEFFKMDNVVLTPHNGGATWDSRSRQFTNMAEALQEFVKAHVPGHGRGLREEAQCYRRSSSFNPFRPLGSSCSASMQEVEVYPFTDQMISVDDLVGAAKRSDYIFAMHSTTIPAKVIEANPNLKGIVGPRNSPHDRRGCMRSPWRAAAICARPKPGAPPNVGVSRATADLTVAMILNLAYRVPEADRSTRARGFRQELSMAIMGIGCNGKHDRPDRARQGWNLHGAEAQGLQHAGPLHKAHAPPHRGGRAPWHRMGGE